MSQERRSDITTLWQKYAPYWHICTAIIGFFVFGVMWYFTVNNAIAQVTKNTSDIFNMQIEFSVMKQDLHDLHEWYKEDHKK